MLSNNSSLGFYLERVVDNVDFLFRGTGFCPRVFKLANAISTVLVGFLSNLIIF